MNISTGSRMTKPFSVWIREDFTKGSKGDGDEIVFGIRLIRSSESAEYKDQDESLPPAAHMPKFVDWVRNLQVDGTDVPKMTVAAAEALPLWTLNDVQAAFLAYNNLSKAEAGNSDAR